MRAGVPALLTLPDGLEKQFWNQPSVTNYVLTWDKYSLFVGVAMHSLIGIYKASWWSHLQPYCFVGPLIQVIQLLWVINRSDSYATWRQALTLVQRLRWFVITSLLQATVPSHALMRSVFSDCRQGDGSSWRVLLQIIGFFATPTIFVAIVHGLPFRHQLAAAPFHTVQHALVSVAHQRLAVAKLGLQPQLSCFCSTMSMVLDPSTSFPLQQDPTWCNSPGFHAWLLVYLHVMLALIIPLHLIHTAEYNSKVRFLCSLEGAAAGGSRQLRPRIKSWPLCLMQCCASCSIGWCLLCVLYALLG
jgi:hypothetical protein